LYEVANLEKNIYLQIKLMFFLKKNQKIHDKNTFKTNLHNLKPARPAGGLLLQSLLTDTCYQ
jgi:hypothetical protein